MTPRAAFGVTPQGAMPADRQSQIGGIPSWMASSGAIHAPDGGADDGRA